MKTETVAAEVQQQPQNNTNNQAVVINMSNVVNGSGMKNYNDVNKKGDDEYITGDDESTSDTTTTTKRLCKSVAAVTTGTRIMLMFDVRTNMKLPMVLKLNASIKYLTV